MAEKKIIDARGSFCPGPLMELIGAIKMVEIGDEIEVLSTDKGSAGEIPQWLKKVGHEFLGSHEEAGVWHVNLKRSK
jgi:TusA-related sulfurtransferase